METSFCPIKILSMAFGVLISYLLNWAFSTGDKIIGVDGEPVERFSSIVEKMLVAEVVNIERNGKQLM